MDLGISTCLHRSCECASEGHRCVVDTLDLAVDSRIKAVCLPLRRRHCGDSYQSSPELNIDSPVYSSPDLRSLQSPVLYDGAVNTVVVAAASTVTSFPDFPVTAETKADSLKSQRPPSVRSSIDALDLAGCPTIPLAVEPPVSLENAKSCPELKMQSSVYGGVQNTVAPEPAAEILARSEPLQYTCSESRCVVDTLDLAVDRRITGVGLPLRRSHGDGFRSSPELNIDSPPVYSRPELKSLQSPVLYDGAVNTVQPEPADMPQKPARSERRKSAFTRSRRFIWKGLVNAARRLCFCSSFVDIE
ncbi:unnamed protein product [Macrosiphum euphorbiae]|uniref:Uncharacterized protein n=1 Tax=Macrosiphum euphorbiae TaxID=13131 RepID=A0AAV0XN48_9HEMI|nr:unnamed protein product [Macrosiphum euphorbiae]